MLLHYRDLNTAGKIQFYISIFLQLTILVAIVWSVFEGRWWVFFVSVMVSISTILPFILIRRRYNLFIPVDFQFLTTLFIYASLFLGEVGGYYDRFWWWDTLLHGASGFALGFAGFLFLYILYLDGKLNVSSLVFAMFTFSFALSVGTLWEIFEFSMDVFFGLNMQNSVSTGVFDTMYDLIVDAIGAILAGILSYQYIESYQTASKNPPRVFKYLINQFLSKNPLLAKKHFD